MDNFKDEIREYTASVLETIKPEDVQEGHSFCDFEEDKEFVGRVTEYVESDKQKCLQNLNCFKPNHFGYGGGHVYFRRDGEIEVKNLVHDFIETLEDFTNYFLYNNYSNKEWQKSFATEWGQFVESYNSDICEVELLAPLYGFWLKFGGKIEDTFDSNEVTLKWLGSQSNFNLLKRSNRDDKAVDILPRYLLSRKVKIEKNTGITEAFNETSNLFKLNTLMLRTLFGGTAHIRFMVVKCIGNLSGYNPGFMDQQYPTFQMQHNRYPTQIDHDFEQTKCNNVWKVLSAKEYGNWVFADTKLLENAAPPRLSNLNKAHSDYMYLVAEQMDKTVNLVQVLESLVGEVGERLGEMVLEVGYTASEQKLPYVTNIKETIDRFVKLRNKYLHGSIVDSPQTTNSLFKLINGSYSQIEDMGKDHELVERAVRKVLEASFLNPELKRICIEHYIHQYPKKKLIHDMILTNPKGKKMPKLIRL